MGASVAVFAAMATEAFINDFSLMLKQFAPHEKDPKLLAANSLLPSLEAKVSLSVKYELLYYILALGPFPKGGAIWNNFDLLIKIRNNIAHFKSSVVEDTFHTDHSYSHKVHREIITELNNKKLLARDVKHSPYNWTMLLDESEPFAAWSIKTAQEIVILMCDVVPESQFKIAFIPLCKKGSSLMGGNRQL